jgi:hypothetical protein
MRTNFDIVATVSGNMGDSATPLQRAMLWMGNPDRIPTGEMGGSINPVSPSKAEYDERGFLISPIDNGDFTRTLVGQGFSYFTCLGLLSPIGMDRWENIFLEPRFNRVANQRTRGAGVVSMHSNERNDTGFRDRDPVSLMPRNGVPSFGGTDFLMDFSAYGYTRNNVIGVEITTNDPNIAQMYIPEYVETSNNNADICWCITAESYMAGIYLFSKKNFSNVLFHLTLKKRDLSV